MTSPMMVCNSSTIVSPLLCRQLVAHTVLCVNVNTVHMYVLLCLFQSPCTFLALLYCSCNVPVFPALNRALSFHSNHWYSCCFRVISCSWFTRNFRSQCSHCCVFARRPSRMTSHAGCCALYCLAHALYCSSIFRHVAISASTVVTRY